MISKSTIFCASIGVALSALLLTGSLRVAAPSPNIAVPAEIAQLRDRGRLLASRGLYFEAHDTFLRASRRSRELGVSKPAIMNLISAGTCLYIALKFRDAEKEFEQARELARSSDDLSALAAAENNLSSLYIHIGEFDKALRVSRDAVAGREGRADPVTHGKLLFQEAQSLAELKRFSEAEPYFLRAVDELTDAGDPDDTARVQGAYGSELLKAKRLDDAEATLCRALWLVRTHGLNASAYVLSNLADVRNRRGDAKAAAMLFRAALDAPPNLNPVWQIRSHQGTFLLERGELAGALESFREARRVALEMRADMVPADPDRVAFESSELRDATEGLVEAGNRTARTTRNRQILTETFDAAEQDRMWSLRALLPSPNDWRSRLPDHYWELLAQYQSLQRTAVATRTPGVAAQIEKLKQEMQLAEKQAAGEIRNAADQASALAHAQLVLDPDSVLFSFLLTRTSAWLWAVDRDGADVYPLPAPDRIDREAKVFRESTQHGQFAAAAELYRDLFGSVAQKYLRRRKWLIEPDGSLISLPFAALRPREGEFLVERASVETIPGALLLERGAVPADGGFLGVGDPVYNTADSRYQSRGQKPVLTLPRLPNTAGELDACSRAWGTPGAVLLTGPVATADRIRRELSGGAAIVHFATHVIPAPVTAPGDYRSGLIALSLDSSGGMGLLGPKEIVARPVRSSLVVMNGCHSAQGEKLASTGLMGLTRAWIGAGARAVIATEWDIPDDAAQIFLTDFYRALRHAPEQGVACALRAAQMAAIGRRTPQSGSGWAAYSLLSRLP